MPSGGKRLNAGRPPKGVVLVRKVVAEQILGSVDELQLWRELLLSRDERIKLEALKYLTNRRDGQPPQSVWLGADQPEPTAPVEMTFNFTRPGNDFK